MVAVAGAGFAGLALACTLLRAGRPVEVFERRPSLPSGGAAVAIQPNGLEALAQLGLLEQAVAAGSRIERVLQHDRRGRCVARFAYAELAHSHPFLLSIRRVDLLRILAREVDRLGGGSLQLGADVSGLIRSNGAVRGLRCRLGANELELRAALVAGADGVSSTVRDELGIPLRSWTTEQRYVVGMGRRPPDLEDGVAWIHQGNGYADGVMPHGDEAYFYNGVTPQNRSAVDTGDLDRWRDAYASRLPYGADVAASITTWDQVNVLEARPQRAARRTAAGAALLGDAAATVHPHAAQGANLALEDGVFLGHLLSQLDPHRHPERSDLASYERKRGRKGARYVAWSRLAGQSFDGQAPLWRANRWIGWHAMRLPILRRALLKFGAGLR